MNSHQRLSGLSGPYEHWAAAGNRAVDRLAESALQSDPAVVECHDALLAELRTVRTLRYHVHGVIIRVGLQSELPILEPMIRRALMQLNFI